MVFSGKGRRARLGRVAAAASVTLALGSAGAVGILVASAMPAGATTVSVTDPMGGPLPEVNVPTPFTFTDNVTLPGSVAPGGTIAMDQSFIFSMPANLANTAGGFGATGFTLTTGATDKIDGSGTTQSSITVSPTNLPLTGTIAQAISGLTMPMSVADFTAGSSGTAKFTQDDISVNATVNGGTLNNTSFSFTMSAGQNMANAGVSTPVPAATLGTVSITSGGGGPTPTTAPTTTAPKTTSPSGGGTTATTKPGTTATTKPGTTATTKPGTTTTTQPGTTTTTQPGTTTTTVAGTTSTTVAPGTTSGASTTGSGDSGSSSSTTVASAAPVGVGGGNSSSKGGIDAVLIVLVLAALGGAAFFQVRLTRGTGQQL